MWTPFGIDSASPDAFWDSSASPEGSGLVSVSPDAFGAGSVSLEGRGIDSGSPDAFEVALPRPRAQG